MIFFEQPTPNGIIFAKQTNNDDTVSVIATCESESKVALESAWDIRGDKLNSVGKMIVARALRHAYDAMMNAAILKDLLQHHAESLIIKD